MKAQKEDARRLLTGGLAELGLSPNDEQVGAFIAYLGEMKKWNRAYSLTSLRTDRDMVIKHFLDSALYLRALPPGTASMADVGSGAGLPGVPIKILMPQAEMHLIEPTGKKAAFLRNIVRRLGLKGIGVIEKRVEEVGELGVDAAVTRALFKAGEFYRKAAHIVRDGGVLVLNKGPRGRDELEGIDCETEEVALPMGGAKRIIVRIPVVKSPEVNDAPPPAMRMKAGSRKSTCANAECELRKAGCYGFEGCPGFKAR